jgi:hypothetical protein
MGGGGSKSSRPDPTANENRSNELNGIFNNIMRTGKNDKKITTVNLQDCWKLITVAPINEYDAGAFNNLKDVLEKFLPYAIDKDLFFKNEIIEKIIEKILERYIEKNKSNLETQVKTQFEVINYYHSVWFNYGKLIDMKYLGFIGILNKSLILHISPLPTTSNDDRNYSLYLYNLVYNLLYDKIKSQFQIYNITPKGNLTDDDTIIFMNTCVKVIDDIPLNRNKDDTEIQGVLRESFDDAQLKNDRIFEDLDSIKNACKLFLFLFRKKNCMKYMDSKNKEVPDYTIFRKCKISGVESIIKPPEEIQRLKKPNEETFENISENTPQKNIEKFTPDIFKSIEQNLKLVFGYILVLILLAVLIYLSPPLFNFLYETIGVVLTVLTEYIVIIGKMLMLSAEGVIFFVIGIISSIMSVIGIIANISMDVIKDLFLGVFGTIGLLLNISKEILTDAIMYFINLFKNFGETSLGAGATLFDIFSNMIAMTFKVFIDAGYGLSLMVYDSVILIFTTLINAPIMLVNYLGNTIFENSKKYYMTINNIEE